MLTVSNDKLIAEVKAFRKRYGASGRHLARIVGISPQGWSKKEQGDAPFYGHELARIARHYHQSLLDAFPSYRPTEDEKIIARELAASL